MAKISRRQLLQAASILPALAIEQNPLFADVPKTGLRFGLVTYLWGQHMELAELISSCEKSGLLGVELRTEHKHGVEPSLTAPQRAEVRKRFADSSVELVGYGSNCEYHSADPAKVRENIEQTKRYVDLMRDCGGTGVKVKPNGFAKGVPREKTIEQIGKSLNEVAAYGAEHGQKIRVEVHGTGTQDLPVMRDIFAIADHPNVYVCWNSNGEDLKGDGLEANFNMVYDRFGDTIHVRELDLGDYPYDQFFGLLRNRSYKGWVLLEARGNPEDKIAAMTAQRLVFEKLAAATL
jgi:sugar phosphate isomerase/epimerase